MGPCHLPIKRNMRQATRSYGVRIEGEHLVGRICKVGVLVVGTLRGASHYGRKFERLSISTNHIARNQEFGLSILYIEAKVQRVSQLKMITF